VGVKLPLRVAVGRIPDAIGEEAKRESADLIIIGRGSAHSSLGRLRTHTYAVIQKSPCPVISV
jgi:nucleotide-binding universal stress UspA family protein